MAYNILISGGTGLVGSALSEMLHDRKNVISLLTRNKRKINPDNIYFWDPSRKEINPDTFINQDTIVHLAGAGVGDKRWSSARKKEILDSRLDSTELLYETLKNNDHAVKTFISASATGIYGYDTGSILVDEDRIKLGDDFLATVVKEWESSVDKIQEIGIRVVKIRMGIVLSKNGGALSRLKTPVKYGIGTALGRGDQYISWIHSDDLCRIFLKAIEDESITGIYNAVAPNPVTNKELMKAIAQGMKKPLWLPNIPGFAMRLILGEMSSMILGGNRVSAEKIESTGFDFKYKYIEEALKDLI